MESNRAGSGLNIFVLLWAAILWSCVVFTGLVFFKFPDSIFTSEALSSDSGSMFFIFLAIAVVNFFSAFIVPGIFFKSLNIEMNTPFEEIEKKYFVPFILKIVLFESCSLFGLVASFNLQANVILPFFALSLMGFLVSFPSKAKIRRELMKTQRRA